MHFEYDETTKDYIARVEKFMAEAIYPAESVLEEQLAANPERWSAAPIVAELRAEARSRDLWNMFLPASAGSSDGGAGLTNLQYAPICEILGRSPKLGPAATNCAAPDTGNMEILREFGTPEQKEQWLKPLLGAEIRSAFCMTEPDVASSDATNIATSIRREGDEYVINGRKWWSTGAMNPDAAIFIVMGKTDPEAERHRQQSMVLVPRDTPGVTVVRALTYFGFDDRDHGGHAEVLFEDVRVPVTNILKGEGEGFAIAQARLGPGRIHHCMRAIGLAERALDLARERANSRTAFHRTLAEQGVIREWMAEARIAIEANRLLVLKTAWLMDTVGNRAAHAEIQAIKVSVPRMLETIVDRTIQIFGAAGGSQDFPLAEMYATARALRIADGPDEVHLSALGKAELRRTH
ncbi:acyl-CoA dehydrogenase [Salinibacterium sp. dk2585]|uniref:acyl-CoA dehydrogenase family protein n=1 Tax=unclassified Salinibacterium TaxID=2632331 RepID=UPI0011C24E53|nr:MULTISPECIES: acyl-CoA dehydrogenase family protein [unclassified Salinibacterium]QEE62708.1 acyl-CoA dehydrogenase [Salinibacterium sp. dk2585]TXK53704.1 acyl-CoA dehydrogenase [Salinibacterium sp. dk5596]